MSEPTATPTDRRSATRLRLQRAALDLFAEHGYDAVSPTDIAAAAGVSERTFFRHFATKVDSVVGGGDARMTWFLDTLWKQPSRLPPLEALLAAIAQEEREFPPSAEDLARARLVRETTTLHETVRSFEGAIEAAFGAWLAERMDRSPHDFDVRLAAAVLVATRRVVFDAWIEADGERSITALTREAFEAIDIRL
ncbi:MAG: TetR family transcriptional regulator [Actinomycetota bacterium]